MEDFEFSVEISDRDWDCFFTTCEECNMLPPSLAGLDDSGMSDLDETASLFGRNVQKVDVRACGSEAERRVDSLPPPQDSPVDSCLSRHGVGGMESVLSGSEEDIHLQCVNVFFERLKEMTEAEASQARAGSAGVGDSQQQQCCRTAASSSSLPGTSPKLNPAPARGEAAAGRDSPEPVHTIRDASKTGKKPEPGSSSSRGRPAQPESTSSITEEACAGSRGSEAARPSQTRDGLIQQDLAHNNPEIREDDPSVSHSDRASVQEWSPCSSIRRRRRKRRRLSAEPDILQDTVRTSDSEEERCLWRGGAGLCPPDTAPVAALTPCSASCSLLSAADLCPYTPACHTQHVSSVQSSPGRCHAMSPAGNDTTGKQSGSRSEDRVKTASNISGSLLRPNGFNLTAAFQREPEASRSEDLMRPVITPFLSLCSVDTESAKQLSNKHFTLGNSSLFVPQIDLQLRGEKMGKHEHGEVSSTRQSPGRSPGGQTEDGVEAHTSGNLLQAEETTLTGVSRSEDVLMSLSVAAILEIKSDTESLPDEHFMSSLPQIYSQPEGEKLEKHEDGDVSSRQGQCSDETSLTSKQSGSQSEDGVKEASSNSGNILQANDMSPTGTLKIETETCRAEDVLMSPLITPLSDPESLSHDRFMSGTSVSCVPQNDSRPGGETETLSQCEDGHVSSAGQSRGGQTEDSVKAVSSNGDVVPEPGLSGHPVMSPQQTDMSGGRSEAGSTGSREVHTASLHPAVPLNHPGGDERGQAGTAERRPVSAVASDPLAELCQDDRLSASKSGLAAETGNSASDAHTLREAELHQQLEKRTDGYSPTREDTHFPVSAGGQSGSDAENTKAEQLGLTEETCPRVDRSGPVDSSRAPSDERSNVNVAEKQTEAPLVLHTSARAEDLSRMKSTESAGSQMLHSESLLQPGDMKPACRYHRDPSRCEDLVLSPPITPVSSLCSLDAESAMSLSDQNVPDVSRSPLSVPQRDSEPLTSQPVANREEGGDSTRSCKTVSECDSASAECEPAAVSPRSVFAMSSFWSEMEKLTINDILGLRMIGKAAVPGSLPALEESEEIDGISMTDSGFFTQLDEAKPEQASDDVSSDLTALEPVSLSSRGLMWDGEALRTGLAADIFSEKMILPSVEDFSQPSLAASSQTRFRKMCKNVSVHDLHALESINCAWKSQTLRSSDGAEEEITNPEDMGSSDSSSGSRISLSGLFQYIFGGKQSDPDLSASADFTPLYTDGTSVPETYDHFFSEFDTDTFFCPLITAEDQASEQPVPVFSYSRSASRNLQFPEAYDHFFASSSSDDSSAEEDEEDEWGPVRVVNRFTRTPSASKLSSDVYDNFFSDSDLRTQDFFWKNTFSFRNISLTGSAVQTQTQSSDALVALRHSGRTVCPVDALGHCDVMFPDQLLHHVEDRISKQLTQRTFSYDDLQAAVSNPRLDTPLLPLRQTDMCLVCIAFASWVLKTANPQAGDAWKAVLLANVSALSAIGYLRKYVKVQAAAAEKKKKPQLKASCES